jgi:hypothetical protein
MNPSTTTITGSMAVLALDLCNEESHGSTSSTGVKLVAAGATHHGNLLRQFQGRFRPDHFWISKFKELAKISAWVSESNEKSCGTLRTRRGFNFLQEWEKISKPADKCGSSPDCSWNGVTQHSAPRMIARTGESKSRPNF